MAEVELNIRFKKPIDYLTYQLKHYFYELSENELKMLAIIHLKGLTKAVKDDIVAYNIFKSKQSVENHLTKFRKKGILKDEKVNLPHPLIVDSGKMTLKINMHLPGVK